MKKNLTAEKTFELAVQSYQRKDFHIAEKLYREILKTHPKKIAIMTAKAVVSK